MQGAVIESTLGIRADICIRGGVRSMEPFLSFLKENTRNLFSLACGDMLRGMTMKMKEI